MITSKQALKQAEDLNTSVNESLLKRIPIAGYSLNYDEEFYVTGTEEIIKRIYVFGEDEIKIEVFYDNETVEYGINFDFLLEDKIQLLQILELQDLFFKE